MSNTIQFNNKEYHRIAAKRDVEAVAQTRYGFFYAHWHVLIDGVYYLFTNPKPINGVYTLETNITIPGSAITSTVYEGMEVPVNIPNNILTTTGTLHINSQYYNYNCPKLTVEQTPGCSLKWPSAAYTENRLVREEDIIKPDTVKLYFDENLIDVECFTKFDIPDYSIVSGTYTGYITRSINDGLNVTVLRSRNSQSYITCHIGDTIKIISKKKSLTNVAIRSYTELAGEYAHIGPLDENGDVITINLQKDGSFDYIIRTDCFITFDITTANYILYGAILEDTEYCDRCTVQVNNTDFIIAGSTELAKRVILENSKVDLNIELSVYTIDAYTKKRDFAFAGDPEYVLVDINNNVIYDTNGSEVYVYTEYNGDSLLTNSQLLIILSDSTSLPLAVQGWYNLIEVINLTTNGLAKVTITGGSHSSNYTAYFTMPSADCLLTVSTKIVTDGDTVTISPLYSLTIDVDENSSSVFPISVTAGNTTTEYNSSTTIQNIENNYFSATWNEVDGKLYHILYKTDYTIFDDYATKATSYSNSLMGNRTLSIRLIDPDIIYRNTTEISTIRVGKEYEENNNIIFNSNVVMALNDYPRRTYYATTESSIKTSGNHFNNLQSLKKVVFNNAYTTFTVNKDAFYECNKLESVSINGTENIKVKDNAFYNAIMLTEFNDLNKITELGKSCFYGVGLTEYIANTALSVIPELAFSESLLSTVDLSASSLTNIDSFAFDNCTKLSKAIIPRTLSTLGNQVFGETIFKAVHTDPLYTDMTIDSDNSASLLFNADSEHKNGLTTLPIYTFEFCKLLEEVHLPASITHIKKGAFHECDNLKHFASPGLKTIELEAFYGTWLEGTAYDSTKFDFVEKGTTYGEADLYKKIGTTGIFFDVPATNFGGLNKNYTMCTYISPKLDNTNLILYKCNKKQIGGIGEGRYLYALHHKTISISPYAFSGKYDFGNIGCYSDVNTGISLDNLNYIGDFTFKSNTRLMSFRFPLNGIVNYLGEGAFYGCSRLSELYNFRLQPITKIKDYTFYNCGDNIYGLGALTDIGYPNLDFYIPDTTVEIGDYAFAKCPQLMAIANLPSCNITKIGGHAFEGSFQNSTWKTKLGAEIACFTTMMVLSLAGGICYSGFILGGQLVINAVNNLIAGCIGASGGAAGTITSIATTGKNYRKQTAELFFPKVTSIGTAAFKDCSHLGAIHLSELLLSIPDYCFENCKRLHTFLFDSEYDSKTGVSTDRMPNITTIGRRAFYNCKNLKVASMNRLLCKAEVLDFLAFANADLTPSGDENLVIFPKTIHTLLEQSLLISNGFTCIFLSKTPPKNVHTNVFGTTIKSKITVFVPEGSKSSYLQKFTTLSSSNFIELSDAAPFWESLNNVYTL